MHGPKCWQVGPHKEHGAEATILTVRGRGAKLAGSAAYCAGDAGSAAMSSVGLFSSSLLTSFA